ncbi:glycosyltransferase [Flagellimonas eckloniae]|nr:glycosyltransferase [Allomuricauda eckloniae]
MDSELACDFYFGDSANTPIKQMDLDSLKGFKKILINKTVSRWKYYWLKGSAKLIFKPYRYYILSGGSKYLSHWFILIFAKILNKKVIVWTHGMKGNKVGVAKFLDILFYKLSHKVLLYGNLSKNVMLREGFKENKLIPIYNSLDYLVQKKIRDRIGPSSIYSDHFRNNFPTLFYIGRIQWSKRLDMLIEALSILNAKGNHCNLIIIGKDVEDVNLPKLVAQHGLEDKVWFYGPCYDEHKIGTMMFNADLCVSPGPIGLTAVHAMTFGLPIVTNDNFELQMPEHEVITKGMTGGFFKENNLESLVGKILEWTNLSKEKRNQVRNDAYEVVDTKYNPIFQLEVLKKIVS